MSIRALPATAAVLSTALLLTTGSAALAASNTLTLTAVNRSGAKVAISATAVNLSTSSSYTLRAGKARKLPKGNYAVVVSIPTGSTTTLGGRTVKVSGNSKLTLDARSGRRISLGLNPAPSGLAARLDVQICTKTDAPARIDASTWDRTALYVIPSKSTKLAYGALGSWTDGSAETASYAVMHRTTGLPSAPAKTFRRTGLATVQVTSRRGPNSANYLNQAVQPVKGGCGDDLWAPLGSTDRPASNKLYLSAGTWDLQAEGTPTVTRKVAAGKAYSVRLNSAGWGPGTELPYTYQGRLEFPLDDMFADPSLSATSGSISDGRGTATLTYRGKVVKTRSNPGGSRPSLYYRPAKAGWYTLTNTATRYEAGVTFPAGMLSTSSRVTYRFPLNPKAKKNTLAPNYSVQIIPAGLDLYNKAKPGSTTTVTLRLNRVVHYEDLTRGANPKLKSLTAKISADGGKTWRAVPVRKIGGNWTAVVKNPAAGYVAVSVRATYTSGGYSESTIYRTYRIG
ncbi:hypothetical protein [Actinoplanes awajinensis]|uniref:Uncharacterized protein n=1 Tax=Actinoplanes awajinensis subsp. mycoplanecinus TaxID=135947 RepID=A0A0X3UPN3_9ACTN|nr:hypothetical protein [Actinoplanes awajinensis]KUL34538.1 hypothetical protein ADL15_15805 [Actinoplanes awajinensis subsp. mycoplanecinus]